jgi:hypothetical protein
VPTISDVAFHLNAASQHPYAAFLLNTAYPSSILSVVRTREFSSSTLFDVASKVGYPFIFRSALNSLFVLSIFVIHLLLYFLLLFFIILCYLNSISSSFLAHDIHTIISSTFNFANKNYYKLKLLKFAFTFTFVCKITNIQRIIIEIKYTVLLQIKY